MGWRNPDAVICSYDAGERGAIWRASRRVPAGSRLLIKGGQLEGRARYTALSPFLVSLQNPMNGANKRPLIFLGFGFVEVSI